MINYAETHFKFKLPWSILFRKWPEIICDMPFQIVPGIKPKMWIILRDCDKFSVTVKKIEIKIQSKNSEIFIEKKIEKEVLNRFEFIPIELDFLAPAIYEIFPKIFVEKKVKNKIISREFFRWNYPRLKPQPLKVKILEENLPDAPGYFLGETHCHTYYSVDHVEYGASPSVMQEAAKMIGLDFVCFTDHAYDFAFTAEDYTKEAASPYPRFEELKKELSLLPNSPLLIAGEEVSAGNAKDENVHLTVLGNDEYIPGLGDCGRFWLENKPTRKLKQIIKNTNAPCFAAHPLQWMSPLERFIFRRGYYAHKDLEGLTGIQFWNGVRDEGFFRGRELWIEELGKGNFLIPLGGNDAHGDLNDFTGVDLPLISLKHSREHVFGFVRTGVFCEGETITQKKMLESLKKGNVFITNGPALYWKFDGNKLQFKARSSKDYGPGFKYIKIFGRRRLLNGNLAEKEEILPESQIATVAKVDIEIDPQNFSYLRAECETSQGYFALTSVAVIPQNS